MTTYLPKQRSSGQKDHDTEISSNTIAGTKIAGTEISGTEISSGVGAGQVIDVPVSTAKTIIPVQKNIRTKENISNPDSEPDNSDTQRYLSKIDYWMITVLAAVSAVAMTVGIADFPNFLEDEGTYGSQARAVFHGSLAPYTYWYDHPPGGWIILSPFYAALNFFMPQADSTLISARGAMVVAAVFTFCLTYVLSRYLGLTKFFSAVAVLILIASPLTPLMMRRIYLDNIALPFLIAALVCVASLRKHLRIHLLGGVFFALSVLSKETNLLLAPMFIGLLWSSASHKNRNFSLIGSLTVAGTMLFMYPLFAILRSELLPGKNHVSLWDAVYFQLAGRAGSGSLFDSHSSRYAVVTGWMNNHYVLPVVGLAAALVCLCIKRWRYIGLIVVMMSAVVIGTTGYLPNMYIATALPFLALTFGFAIEKAWKLLVFVTGKISEPAYRGYRIRFFRNTATKKIVIHALATVVILAALAAVLSPWRYNMNQRFSQKTNTDYYHALQWLDSNINNDDAIAVDDVFWQDLVDKRAQDTKISKQEIRADQKKVIWYNKLDLDPEVKDTVPRGWKDIKYVVSTHELRIAVVSLKLQETEALLDNSDTVATFGDGDMRIEIKRIAQLP